MNESGQFENKYYYMNFIEVLVICREWSLLRPAFPTCSLLLGNVMLM
jgi:hypothetical protein